MSDRRPAVDEKYLRPKKANDLMKSAQNIHQAAYIYGTTGFGKTSFAADYLSRRKYEYYSAAEIDFSQQELSGSNDCLGCTGKNHCPAGETVILNIDE